MTDHDSQHRPPGHDQIRPHLRRAADLRRRGERGGLTLPGYLDVCATIPGALE